MKLGVDLFSLRFTGWNAFQYLDYVHEIGLQVAMFPDPAFLESLEESYLRRVKAHADGLGLDLEVGMYSICPTSTSFSCRAAPFAWVRPRTIPMVIAVNARIIRLPFLPFT